MRARNTALVLCAALTGITAGSAGAAPLHRGFFDQGVLRSETGSSRTDWLGRMRSVGAERTRIDVNWATVAPTAPGRDDDLRDPAWPGYSWQWLDDAVRDSVANGLTPVLTIQFAPGWAQKGAAPGGTPAGAWKPDPARLAEFATALARRYHGTVHYWQAWNEPNLDTYLAPQWVAGKPFAPAYYRKMLNAFYAAVKGVDPANIVLSAGTAPFGDPGTAGHRMMPALFLRTLLCFTDRALRPARCPDPAHFDVLDHHPYSVRGPDAPALNDDDVSVPDLAKLKRPLAKAIATGRVLPRRPKPLWTTEISWDSSPPDPEGVPAERHARWLEESLYVLRRQRVDTVLWFQARDAAPVPSYAATYQSGVFELDGTPKPAATAFAFPFVAHPISRRAVRYWGIAPAGARRVTIERAVGSRWVAVGRSATHAGGIFTGTVAGRQGWRLRATAGASSLAWTVGRS